MRVRFSILARDQLRSVPERPRRELLQAVRQQLIVFPESAPALPDEDYAGFRQLVRSGYRLLYRYDNVVDEIQIYCVLHVRQRFPPPAFLQYQAF